MIWIITGEIKSGKTTLLQKIVDEIGPHRVLGFITPTEFKDGEITSYVAHVLPDGEKIPLVSRKGEGEKVGRFVLLQEGKKRLVEKLESVPGDFDIFVFDEFGLLESKGRGLRKLFDGLMERFDNGIVVVRKSILGDFLKGLEGMPYEILEVGSGQEKVANFIENLKKEVLRWSHY